MKSYQAIDHYNIKGRGHVITVKIPRTDPLPKIDEAVLIDDTVYAVIGVECSWKPTAPPRRSESVGLLVKS